MCVRGCMCGCYEFVFMGGDASIMDVVFLQLVAEIKEAKKELKKAQTIMQMDELKCRKRVLRRLVSVHSTDWDTVFGRIFLVLAVCYKMK